MLESTYSSLGAGRPALYEWRLLLVGVGFWFTELTSTP